MNVNFSLEDYVSNGIESVIKGIIKASFKNPKETAFIMKFALAIQEAEKKKKIHKKNIPAFLIASISSTCNLFCSGCYARANKSCNEDTKDVLSEERWESIFKEAAEMGISFILLAGGEPFMRREVLIKASEINNIMFPVFTNGTMLNDNNLNLLDKKRNLVPILSIEGDKEYTDSRRGKGTYELLMNSMDDLNKRGILYGVSITVTTHNVRSVTSTKYFETIYRRGCKAVVFVEYVPVTDSSKHLAPTDLERKILEEQLKYLRDTYKDAIFLSFPGDEKYSGGCLAGGRGFFHINANGSAEPCPFSPFSDINLKNCTLENALNSPLFQKLNASGMLMGEHDGGCLLFEHEEEVRRLLEES